MEGLNSSSTSANSSSTAQSPSHIRLSMALLAASRHVKNAPGLVSVSTLAAAAYRLLSRRCCTRRGALALRKGAIVLQLARVTWAAALEELVARIMAVLVMIASQEVVLAQHTAVPDDKQAMALGWRYRPRSQGKVDHAAAID